MKNYARVVDGVVIEVIELPDDFNLGDIYVPDVAAQFKLCKANVGAGWTYDGKTFSLNGPSLDQQKASKIADLTASCSADIIGGYASNALGAVYTYPSQIIDQVNMLGSVMGSLFPGLATDWKTSFWCKDGSGVWDWRDHTASQIQQAGVDGKAHILSCQSILAQLSATVNAATTSSAIDAVMWPAS